MIENIFVASCSQFDYNPPTQGIGNRVAEAGVTDERR